MPPDQMDESGRYLVLLRWVLIIAIAYLVLFSRPLTEVPPVAAVFIAFYLASNLALVQLLRLRLQRAWVEWGVVVLDIGAVTVALALTGEGHNDLFVLYFVVLFLSALTDGVLLSVAAALFIGAAHLYTAAGFVDAGVLIEQGYMVRIPFLFAVALFFGNLVQRTRSRQRDAQDGLLRAQRMELLSTVSHDLRNPLGVIDSLTGLLLDGDAGRLNTEQTGLLERIRVSIRQVLHLSNNLIDAERIELNNFPVRFAVCDLRVALEETLMIAETAAGLKGVSLLADLPQAPLPVVVDSIQIERAVANLVGNAIKFTSAGGSVRISMRREGESVRIEVADTGSGFPENLLQDLGRKHHLGSQAKGTGSGLGLYIAGAVTRAHGGRIVATNRSGGGAVIALEIPVGPVPGLAGSVDSAELSLAKA